MKRIHYLDVSRGIAILLVILGHCYSENNIRTWIYSFHMPIFFIMSGMLISYKNETETSLIYFLKKKLKSNLVPYLFFSLPILIGEAVVKSNLLDNLYSIFTGFGLWALWFIPCLFLTEILFITIFKSVKNKHVVNLICLVLFGIGLFLKTDMEHRILIVIMRSFVGLGFLVVGYYCTPIIDKIKASYLTISLFLIASLVFTFLNPRVELWNLTFNNIALYVLISIIGSMAIIILCKKINKNKCLEFYGKSSLIILGTHQFLLKIFFTVGNKFIKNFDSNSIIFGGLVFILSVLAEIVIIFIIKRYFKFILGVNSYSKQKSIITVTQ